MATKKKVKAKTPFKKNKNNKNKTKSKKKNSKRKTYSRKNKKRSSSFQNKGISSTGFMETYQVCYRNGKKIPCSASSVYNNHDSFLLPSISPPIQKSLAPKKNSQSLMVCYSNGKKVKCDKFMKQLMNPRLFVI